MKGTAHEGTGKKHICWIFFYCVADPGLREKKTVDESMVVAATNLPLPLSRGENGCFRKNEVAFGLVDFQGVSFFSDHCVADKG